MDLSVDSRHCVIIVFERSRVSYVYLRVTLTFLLVATRVTNRVYSGSSCREMHRPKGKGKVESDSTNGTTIFKTPTNTRISTNESTMLPSSRLLHELSDPINGITTSKTLTNTRTSTNESTTLPSTTVDEVVRNDDDPPPYSPIAPPNHVGWPFDFSGNRYSAYNATTYTTAPLAPFQTSLTSPGFGFHTERAEEHASISMPLMPCRLFMFGSRRSLFPHDGPTFTDNISVNKEDNHERTHRYGAILIGAAVIIFLMVLSLLVRLIMDKNLWRS
ncbi:LOW QUALITY PROTEIN: uncharacterized protein LOC122716815 [Apis laboriosa]|uniref:LOW QUALITY PROTEIN: uncharacterized protein LOC122716815 n=1 Tax=Apis laboriosa TaxID=183418 RepID=UPI001CC71187|nr:LOW QUALITY PROTEIN: uncharacterized protein LOC122716815 [Apis laboriosa]